MKCPYKHTNFIVVNSLPHGGLIYKTFLLLRIERNFNIYSEFLFAVDPTPTAYITVGVDKHDISVKTWIFHTFPHKNIFL